MAESMPRGPYVNAAAFCDNAVLGQDGTLSIIRIIDTITNTAFGDPPPDEMPPFVIQTKLVVSIKAGESRGRFKLKFRPEAPDGRQMQSQEQAIHLDGGMTGVNVVTDVQLGVDQEGVYWFDVLFEAARDVEQLLTRVPLRVVYSPQIQRG